MKKKGVFVDVDLGRLTKIIECISCEGDNNCPIDVAAYTSGEYPPPCAIHPAIPISKATCKVMLFNYLKEKL